MLHTPIGQLELAIEGKVEFVRKTSPWGSDETEAEADARKMAEQPANPAQAARQLLDWVKRKQAHDSRHKRK